VPSSFVVLTNYRQERTIKLSAACGLVSCQHLIVGPPKRDQAAPRWCLIFGPTFRARDPETPPQKKRCQHTYVSSFPFVAGIILTVHLSHLLIWLNGNGNGNRGIGWDLQ